MSSKRGKSRAKRAEEIVQQRVEEIDADIDKLTELLKPYERISQERDKLKAARRALLGGSKLTGEGSARVSQEDVVKFLTENPGSSTGEVASALSVPQTTISSHLYRGKGERFLTKDKKWWVRSPKDGINTVDDIEEE